MEADKFRPLWPKMALLRANKHPEEGLVGAV